MFAQILNPIDYFAVLIGGLTGTLFACNRRLDIIGAVACGLLTGYGGGILRDMLLRAPTFYFMDTPDLILLTIALCVFVFFFQGIFLHIEPVVFFCDALSVGMFVLAGASKAYRYDVDMILVVILGGLTGVGGGALRDISVGEIPGVFQKSNFYAVAALGGAASYAFTRSFGLDIISSSIACVTMVILLRYWSVRFDWKTVESKDFTPVLTRAVKQVTMRLSKLLGFKTCDYTADYWRQPRRFVGCIPLSRVRMRSGGSKGGDTSACGDDAGGALPKNVEAPTDKLHGSFYSGKTPPENR